MSPSRHFPQIRTGMSRRRVQAGVVTDHHRLVLGLGYLVLAGKILGQSDLGLGLIRPLPSLVGLPIVKSWLHPDHFEVHRGVEVDKVVGLRELVNIL